MKQILITNDDGIFADGLVRLASIAKEFGDVWVVAPDGKRSAASHRITLHQPVDVNPAVDFPVEGVYDGQCEEGTDFRAVIEGFVSIELVNNVGYSGR